MNATIYRELFKTFYYQHAMLCAQWISSSIVSKMMLENPISRRVCQRIPILDSIFLTFSFEDTMCFWSMYNDDIGEFVSAPSRCIEVYLELHTKYNDDMVVASNSAMIWISKTAKFFGYDILEALCTHEFVDAFVKHCIDNHVGRGFDSSLSVNPLAYCEGYDNLD